MIHRLVQHAAVLMAMLVCLIAPANGQDSGNESVLNVSGMQFESRLTNLRGLEVLNAVPIELGLQDGRYGDSSTGEVVRLTLQDLFSSGSVALTMPAIDEIARTLAREYADQSGIEVFICPSPQDIDPLTGADLRPATTEAINMIVVFDGPRYDINSFELAYAIESDLERPELVDVKREVHVELYRDDRGYVGWRPGVPPELLSLGSFNNIRVSSFSAGAVQTILEAISRAFMDRQIMGTYVRPDPAYIGGDLSDLRTGDGSMRLLVYTSAISGIRTLASGDRVPPSDRINHPAHARLRTMSPFQPASDEVDSESGEATAGDILRKDILDDYLYLLSRHPGRRVDAAVAPGAEANTLSLDYIVTERKPWTLYYQGSNTGTAQTGRWRNRFGLFNNQLTGNDDILNLEYISPDFKDTNTVSGLYSGRVGDNDRLRWNLSGFWSEYVASEVGFANETFTGESWGGTLELAWNVHQQRQAFIDVIGGLRYLDVDVTNQIVNIEGQANFAIPYIGARFERFTEEMNTAASITFEGSSASWTDVARSDLNGLGRLFPDEDFTILKWDIAHSMFLEPVLNRDAWLDVTTPESSTLAHEAAFRFRGQYAFDKRLIPQLEQVMGGLYSVRGYPESVAVGDTALVFNAEYRIHVPRAFPFEEQPGELFGRAFRWAPQQPYGRADWDLVLKAFFDIGRTINSNSFSFENDETLMGTGVGLELVFKNNASVRLDWGFALKELPSVEEGANRLHVVGSLFY